MENGAELKGLTNREAAKRLAKDGPNEVARPRKLTGFWALVQRFSNPLILILIVAAALAFILGDRASALIIIVIVTASGLLESFNTHRSAKAAEALKQRVKVFAQVIRDGRSQQVPLAGLVKGDIVELRAGSLVPADGKVIDGEHLFANESVLTGESFPQPKDKGAQVFMGSSVVSGRGFVELTATGGQTKFSHIAAVLSKPAKPTAFDRELKDFSVLIVKITFSVVIFIFAINAILKHQILESLLFSLALAVGLTPELLPIILTLNLTKGSLAMAKRRVIVKRLSAIQNLGSMDVLCTDKTGTLTEDRIVLVKHLDENGKDSDEVLRLSYLASLYATTYSNPLDEAIREFKHLSAGGFRKVDEIPFDFERKRDSMVVAKGSDHELITKGAPEGIFKICRYLTAPKLKKIEALYESLSQEGFRVLAVASKKVRSQKDYTPVAEVDMDFAGFIAFLDPAKKSVEATLKRMHGLGIEVKIITGDNALTTQKIAADIDLPVKGTLAGDEISHLSDPELSAKLAETTIFARINPEQKMRVIELLQKSGRVVGYMGDGINDAPPLRAADVSISVNNAVDVAKETADIILLDKSLHDLTEGVIEGRKTFANTLKYLKMSLSSNFGNMFSMAGASILLPFLPMLAPQILLNNLLYDTSQFAIPLDQVDKEEITLPHRLSMVTIKRFMWTFGPLSSVFDFVTFGALYFVFHLSASQFQTGWFIESLATQTLVVYIVRTRLIPFFESRPSPLLVASTLSMLAVGVFIALTVTGHLFGFHAIPSFSIGAIGLIVAAYLTTTAFVKHRLLQRLPL